MSGTRPNRYIMQEVGTAASVIFHVNLTFLAISLMLVENVKMMPKFPASATASRFIDFPYKNCYF